jgi:hypothetical protein
MLADLSYLEFDDNDEILSLKNGSSKGSEESNKEIEQYIERNHLDNKLAAKIFYFDKLNYFFYNSIGAIAAYSASDDIVSVNIGFRGTRNGFDFMQDVHTYQNDLDDETELCPTQKVSGHVHAGFLRAYIGIANNLKLFFDDLSKKYPKAKFHVELSGHSLGGALASIAALQLSCHFESQLKSDPDAVTRVPSTKTHFIKYKHIGHECRLYPTQKEHYLSVIDTPHPLLGYLAGYEAATTCLN